jgi:hypothetical protein
VKPLPFPRDFLLSRPQLRHALHVAPLPAFPFDQDEFCVAVTDIAQRMNARKGRWPDRTTRHDGVELDCEAKTLEVRRFLNADPDEMREGWEARKQREWNARSTRMPTAASTSCAPPSNSPNTPATVVQSEMTFEDELNELNKQYFFREFTFSRTEFTPPGGSELELADALILLGSDLVAFQLKAREAKSEDAERETRWFKDRVVKEGTKQIRDTLRYLEEHQPLEIANHRGHKQSLSLATIRTIQKVVSYDAARALPAAQRNQRYYRSSTAGLIHLIPAADYLGIVRTLLTPAELIEYLAYREELIEKWADKVSDLSEQALVGHYLVGDIGAEPTEAHRDAVRRIKHEIGSWDISGILKLFADRIVSKDAETQYYPIITELAKLKRNELAEFKTRYLLTREKAKQDDIAQPFRMMSYRTGCAFVFIPIPASKSDVRQRALVNFTIGAKYDLKAFRCIGVAITPEEGQWWATDWCFLEEPWRQDDVLDEFLKHSPFRAVNEVELRRYKFKDA